MSLVRFRFWALYMREWLSGRASPCQGEGREFRISSRAFCVIWHRSNFIGSMDTLCASGSVVEHRLAKARVASSNLVSRFLRILLSGKTLYHMREWLSGRASPCQGEGREFESRLALFQRVSFGCSLFYLIFS